MARLVRSAVNMEPLSRGSGASLRRLEWSRPYAQRVLARLEDAGLVRAVLERTAGQGRSRKLYELAPLPPPEWG
jgi:predicted ArsR family transcriptional regulator